LYFVVATMFMVNWRLS